MIAILYNLNKKGPVIIVMNEAGHARVDKNVGRVYNADGTLRSKRKLTQPEQEWVNYQLRVAQ